MPSLLKSPTATLLVVMPWEIKAVFTYGAMNWAELAMLPLPLRIIIAGEPPALLGMSSNALRGPLVPGLKLS
jgi:hypothetical protein